MKGQKLRLAVALCVVGALATTATTARAYNAYDFYPYSSCVIGSGTQTYDVDGYLECSTSDPEFPCITHCPIVTVYPRTGADKLDQIYFYANRQDGSYAGEVRLCARQSTGGDVDCTSAESFSAGTGYKSVLIDSGTTGWSTVTANTYNYTVYLYSALQDGDQIIGYKPFWTVTWP